VAAELQSDPEARRILSNVLRVSELDDQVWESSLAEALRVPNGTAEARDAGWREFWSRLRRAPAGVRKIFLDKYLLTKLLGRDIPVIAVFLHDVQRARRGNSIFGINTTFKSNHFLGYTVALNRLDGVYYVDPRPEMLSNQRLREQIHDFQQFLLRDLWTLTGG
jgi:hypothetical protein